MRVGEYDVPDNLLYTREHEWVRLSGQAVVVGVTDYAAKTLNDVVYVTVPKVGETVAQLKVMGTVESIKAVSELYSPVSGTITSVNDALSSHPELVNTSPYNEGWIVNVRPSNLASEKRNLLDAKGYMAHLESILKQHG